jgi:hypothetical protein
MHNRYVSQLQGRLIVTSHDLSVQFWNINDGSPLLQVSPQLFSTTLAHLYLHQPRAITTMSFEHTYAGSTHRRVKKWLLLGTDHGNLCGYQEGNSVIEECPTFFLRLTDFAPMEHVVKQALEGLDDTTGKLNKFVSGLVQNKRAGSVMYESAAEIEAEAHHGAHSKHTGPHAPHAPHRHDTKSQPQPHRGAGKHLLVGGRSLEEGSIGGFSHIGGFKENSTGIPIVRLSHVMLLLFTILVLHLTVVTTASEALKHSAEQAVLWTQIVDDTNILLVGYMHGLVALWDIEKMTRLHDLPMHQYGPVLMAMRTKESLKQAQAKHASLSRYKRPLFAEAFSSLLNLNNPPAAGAGNVGSGAAAASSAPGGTSAARPPSAADGTVLAASLNKSAGSAAKLLPASPRDTSPTAAGARKSLRLSKSPSQDQDEEIR